MDHRAADIVHAIFDAAIAIDARMRIVACNRGAEKLLSRRANQVIGKRCNEIVRGLDAFGNRYCDEECAIMKMARLRDPVHHTQLDVPGRAGGCSRTDVVTLRIPADHGPAFTLVHVFLPLGSTSRSDAIGVEAQRSPSQLATQLEPNVASLSPREREIVRHLADGLSTKDIAAELSISPATVRNHVQHLLRKMGVHSKTAAVAIALRRDDL